MKELFNAEFWTMEVILNMIDAFAYFIFAIAVLYLLIFAIKSLGSKFNSYEKAKKKYRYAVIFPAYMEDRVIINSVSSFMEQSYERNLFDVFVVSDRMSDETNKELEELGAIVVRHDFSESTKTKALQEAAKYIAGNELKYDIVVILDADNLVDEYFLDKINDAFFSGCSAIQTHRVAKNYNSNIAILDSVSEEINNSIFRKGHTAMGFSSSLIGSGMAFEYDLFERYIMKIGDIGVDKQLEKWLLKDGHYIEYLQDIYTYDEKVAKSKQFYKQRKRWINNQFYNLITGIWRMPIAAIEGNWDYCNKLLQWSMPPRIMLLGLLLIISVIMSFINIMFAIKWWVLLVLLLVVFAIAIPDYLFNKNLFKALISLPLLFVLMAINMLTVYKTNKKFIHTEHFEP